MAIWYFFYTTSSIMVMMLIMTMNGYVNVAVGVGLTIGYIVTELHMQ